MAGEGKDPQDGDDVSDTEKLNWFSAIEVAPRKGLGIIGDNPPTAVPRPSPPVVAPRPDDSESEAGPRKRRRFRR